MTDSGTVSVHKTTAKAIEILDFIRRSDGATLADVVEHFNISQSTAYTHLNTLNRQGLVVREYGRYWIGLRFREFSVSARTRKPSFQLIKKKITELETDTGSEIEFLVEEAGRVNLVFHTENVRHDRVRLHLHNTAAGKAILAETPREQVQEVLDRWGMPQATTNTITNREVLFEELDLIRERGYAYNDKECFEGYHGIGASIEGVDGSTLGALTIGGPVYRVDEDALKTELVDLLLETVGDIEEAIEANREMIVSEFSSRS